MAFGKEKPNTDLRDGALQITHLQCYKKAFLFLTYEWAQLPGVLALGKPLRPCLMFADKARSLT